MGAYARWQALAADERRLTVKSGTVIGVAVVALRVLSVQRTLRIASRPVKGRTKTVIGDVVAAIDRAGRYVPGTTCLSQSLALAWLLRRRGVDAGVCIGTRQDNGLFEAHAWVEVAGAAINDAPPGYAALFHSSQFTVYSSQFQGTANRKL